MAYLRQTDKDIIVHLRTHHTFGRRSDAVDTCVNRPDVSKIHAAMEWNGECWQLRHLGRNGTWLDQESLENGRNHDVKTGQVIYFAEPGLSGWVIEDLSAPRDQLVPLDPSAQAIPLQNYQLLPASENPETALYFCSRRAQWILDANTNEGEFYESRSLEHGDIICFSGSHWRLFLVGTSKETEEVAREEGRCDWKFLFDLSLDEESTHLRLQTGRELVDLGERIHHYLLLHLARCRAEDAASDIGDKSQGWVDCERLSRELGIDAAHINMLIFRARKQFAELHIPDDVTPIERRRGYVRFGSSSFVIHHGSKKACELPLLV
ncbi:FHA domain-containing protein [Exilibacterium tricleocarpae]|uniref:FHA domain-containing protein n=1 Tax=Exilibacterium tricleocarpae TaxID=2591008 RepID=A0A545TVC2_9GAMM|nr:FHA domain-containing protein [Exilibacterium tricleocarpae]TQV81163.1 FHA domain-containing protein [Exilibacterium tricleocarpae]